MFYKLRKYGHKKIDFTRLIFYNYMFSEYIDWAFWKFIDDTTMFNMSKNKDQNDFIYVECYVWLSSKQFRTTSVDF